MQDSQIEQQSKALLSVLMNNRRFNEVSSHCQGVDCQACQQHPQRYIIQALKQKTPLTMILPAFPAKSANRQKTLSEKPDMGEIMGLKNLNAMCKEMQSIYEPGVKLIICSDGRVFNDLVLVSDHDVNVYQYGIKNIIADSQLHHLTTFSLDDIYPYMDYPHMRELLMHEFGEPLEQLRTRMHQDENLRYQFNGIHRFVVEDQMVLRQEQSKNQVRKSVKQTAYEVIRRSNAWSRLLADYFPEGLRLSIHPQHCGSDKLGIQFLPAANCWATPWHNVLLKNKQGWQLIKRQDAELMGARLNHDHYILGDC